MMRVLTLTQPWATLVAIGAKTIETRDWNTSHRGELAIHAAKGFPADERYLCTTEPFRSALGIDLASELPVGKIIAVVQLEATWQFTDATVRQISERSMAGALPPHEVDFGNYGIGRYGFRLVDRVVLPEPVPARGMLNLWRPAADVEAAVREQLRKVA